MRGLLALVGALVLAGPAAAAPALSVTQHHTSAGDEYVTIAGTGLDSVKAARCRHAVTLGAVTVANSAAVNADGTFAATTKRFKPAGPYGIAIACDDPGGSPTGSFAGTLTPIAVGDGTPVSLPFVAAQPPAPTIAAPVAGTYVLGKQVDARYRCANAFTCVGPVPSGSPIDTSTVGPHTFTVTATSGAGLTATTSVTYRVVYPWNGFFGPVTNTESGQLNLVHPGDLVRFKFWLDGDRTGHFTGGSPKTFPIPCPYLPTHDVPAAGDGATPGLMFGDGHYVYGVQTKPAWAGTCWRVEVDLDDGTSHTADLKFPGGPTIDLEPLTVASAQQGMAAVPAAFTSLQLTQAYLDRIHALNSHGPGLNAVRAIDPDGPIEADASDARRAAGHLLGPMDGIPILLKDNIDVAGMPTTAGSIPLEHSMPPEDSTVAANLKAAGAVILGKTNLSEFANFITNTNPSGYSGVGGQVLAAVDADLNPSGSSSGSGTAAAASLATVTIGTETSGSIISPSLFEGDVGLRPTVGLVSRYGIVPIAASQDTAGPIVRNVADAAAVLQAIAGPDVKDHSPTLWGPGVDDSVIVPPQPLPVPNYMAALDPNALNGARIGTVTSTDVNYNAALAVIQSRGATLMPISTPGAVGNGNLTALLDYEFHRDLNNYLGHIGPSAPAHTLAEVIAANNTNPLQAIKFGHTELVAAQAQNVDDLNSAQSVTYRTNLVAGKTGNRANLDNPMVANNLDAIVAPAATLIGIGARAGYPQITVNAGYSTTTRRPVNISFSGTKYSEAKLIGFAYAYEQATKLRQPSSLLDPSMYRCAGTVPPPPFASRGGCAPGHELMSIVGTPPSLPFSLETTGPQELESKLAAGTLTSVDLTKAYLARIAQTNVDRPSTNAVRAIDPTALTQAAASDARRAAGHAGPLEGLPVLISDDVDVSGLPTTDGSVALQHSMPNGDSKLVANLKAAGAIVLGKTNTTELSGWMSTTMPAGYSSLGGQVLDPSDADINPSGSSSGSAVAASAGLAALTIGTEASQVNGSLESIVSPAQQNAVVGLKPTVGLVSRTGVLPVSLTQETPGVLSQTVWGAAAALGGIAGPDAADPGTSGQPSPLPDYLSGLSSNALQGKRIAVIAVNPNNPITNMNYLAAIAAVQAAGATTAVKTFAAPSPNPADIVGREQKRDMNAYLSALPAGDPIDSLQEIVDYNNLNAQEALKYGMATLTNSNAVDLTNPTTLAQYVSDRDSGLASNRAVIDAVLNNGTPADTTDDFDAALVPSGDARIGIADRAGYPVLSVPAGYNNLNAGNRTTNPVNVTFVGTAYSEPRLLADAYAYEQKTLLRQGPSTTNPSLWRCVPGSAFPPHSCAP